MGIEHTNCRVYSRTLVPLRHYKKAIKKIKDKFIYIKRYNKIIKKASSNAFIKLKKRLRIGRIGFIMEVSTTFIINVAIILC